MGIAANSSKHLLATNRILHVHASLCVASKRIIRTPENGPIDRSTPRGAAHNLAHHLAHSPTSTARSARDEIESHCPAPQLRSSSFILRANTEIYPSRQGCLGTVGSAFGDSPEHPDTRTPEHQTRPTGNWPGLVRGYTGAYGHTHEYPRNVDTSAYCSLRVRGRLAGTNIESRV